MSIQLCKSFHVQILFWFHEWLILWVDLELWVQSHWYLQCSVVLLSLLRININDKISDTCSIADFIFLTWLFSKVAQYSWYFLAIKSCLAIWSSSLVFSFILHQANHLFASCYFSLLGSFNVIFLIIFSPVLPLLFVSHNVTIG